MRKRGAHCLRIVLGWVALAGTLLAHHSLSATYFEDQKIKIDGTLQQFFYRNPHSFLLMESKASSGEVTHWMVEWTAGGQLGREKITQDTLRPGDHLVIVGNPGRNPQDHRVRMFTVSRPSDGWRWTGNE